MIVHRSESRGSPAAACGPGFWPCVTAFGALWGLSETTVGAFLHALRLPFTGVLMASLGAGLLVAQRQAMPRRGASLATGVVAAICKSMSPGGVILGPMVGILAESALVEAALLPAPRWWATAMLAGMWSATWAAFQKILTHFLLYGGTVLDLYLSLLRQAARMIGLPEGAGWPLLGGLLLVIGAVGAAGGLLGWHIGREGMARITTGDREVAP
ncbi:MAG TPA: hypothetical protein PLQ97_11205 [Myxococcota bacterium]|nr:hypothetical protein [Myxococcota bacterium]HQK51698.1 hypothetical protein [Myxococcota bacterium]